MKHYKRFLSGTVALGLTIVAASAALADDVTEEIVIDSVDDLMQFAADVNTGEYNDKTDVVISLQADLDLSGVDWTPIGYPVEDDDDFHFSGTFLGNGHTVSNIDFTESYENGVVSGFFGDIEGGEVSGLNVTGTVDVKNADNYVYFGSIAGVAGDSLVSNCVSDIDIKNNGKYVYGTVGMVGYAMGSTVEYCENKGNIEITGDMGSLYIGGVAGYVSDSTVQYCANMGDITASGAHVGGVAGELYNASKMNNCYSVGKFTPIGKGTSDAAGLVGTVNGAASVTNCYFAGETDLSQYTATPPYKRLGAIAGKISGDSTYSNNFFSETENLASCGMGAEADTVGTSKTYEYMTTENFYNEIVENGGVYRLNAEGTPLLPLPKYDVTFVVTPAGVENLVIKLDGEVIDTQSVELTAGEYTLEVTADGYQTLNVTVTISADTATHTQNLELTPVKESSSEETTPSKPESSSVPESSSLDDTSSDVDVPDISSVDDTSKTDDVSDVSAASSARDLSSSGSVNSANAAANASNAPDANPSTGGTASAIALLVVGGAIAAVQAKRRK